MLFQMGKQIFLLIFAFTFSEFAVVDSKFCAFELNGIRRYYTCPRNEYCCNFGCCVSPAFQFYQLWYYWLLVIFIFLLCSGGGWWYRYWLQSRYRTCPGSILPVTNTNSRHRVLTRAASLPTRRPCRPRVARVSYNPSRDAVVLHRIWKGTRNCSPPSYSSAQGDIPTDSGNHHSSTLPCAPVSAPSLFPLNQIARSSTGQESPYYQLYGPPPSYDSVMSEIGESSLPLVPSAVRPINDMCPILPGTNSVPSTRENVERNVITQQSLTESASSSHHDDKATNDNSSITFNYVHTAHADHSTNVQNQHPDACKETQSEESNNTST